MQNKKNRLSKTESLNIQPRDINIFRFLDRVGYATLAQVTLAIGAVNTEKEQESVLRRLYVLRRSGHIKVFKTHIGNYYALDKKAKINNPIITSIKLDQLEHHNFLTELFFHVQNEQVESEREVIAKYKVVGKKGRVPDMIINDWIIEFERSSKNNIDTQAVVFHWTIEQGKNLCVIYETEEIKNRYTKSLNPRVRLLAKEHYRDILNLINSDIKADDAINENVTIDNTTILTKVLPDNILRILEKYK
ncbi:MAG: hypothetical protein ACK5Z5_09510 [Neisseriaceae bacterium]|jgi:hypothetical protein